MTDQQLASRLVGAVLADKYCVERVIGVGGMGIVVAARHLELGELFAIKFLQNDMLKNSTAVERFLREARASVRLKGEHAVKVHDVGRLPGGAPYIVMEYLRGHDLAEVISQRSFLDPTMAVAYVLQVCDALVEAHGLGIVHRDLKPGNLFLTRRPNGTACVKVLDFGISKQLQSAPVDVTKTSAMLGSPQYMSPEQMLDSKRVDPRSDIWSLGIVLYELLTGTVPFRGETLPEVISRVLQETPEPPSVHRANLPAALDDVVMRCLNRQIEARFSSAQELADALHAFLSTAELPPGWRGPEAIPMTQPIPEHLADTGIANTAPMAPLGVSLDRAPSAPNATIPFGSPQAILPASSHDGTQARTELGVGPLSSSAASSPAPTPSSSSRGVASGSTELMPSGPAGVPSSGQSRPPTHASWGTTAIDDATAAELRPKPRTKLGKILVIGLLVPALAAGAFAIHLQVRKPFTRVGPRGAEGPPDASGAQLAVSMASSGGPTVTPVNANGANRWIRVEPPSTPVALGLDADAPQDAVGFRSSASVVAPTQAYEIQQHEVTWGELDPWVGGRSGVMRPAWLPGDAKGRERLPVTGIAWETARDYCQGIGARLPTEEEIEFAARGPARRPHPWGDEPLDLGRVRAYRSSGSGLLVASVMTSTQDRTPGPDANAVYDLAGNALEWTADVMRSPTGEIAPFAQGNGVVFRAVRGLPRHVATPPRLPTYTATVRMAFCATGACPETGRDEVAQFVGFRCVRSPSGARP